MKFLIWIVIGFLAVSWFKSAKRQRMRGDGAGKPHQRSADAGGEAMLACARCGLHLPASEALLDGDGKAYCSEQHRREQHAP